MHTCFLRWDSVSFAAAAMADDGVVGGRPEGVAASGVEAATGCAPPADLPAFMAAASATRAAMDFFLFFPVDCAPD